MKLVLRFCLAAMVVTAFAACGGGGGSAPAPVASSAPLLPQAVERNDVQSALTVLEALTLFAEFTAFPGASVSIEGSCAQSSTQTSTPTGPVSYAVVVTQYYDTACTQRHVVINGNMRDGRTGSLFATQTTYSRGGSTTGYDTIDVTTSSLSSPIGVAITAASTAGARPATRQNLLCTREPLVCGVASTTSLTDGSMLGASFVLTIGEATSGSADILNVTSPVNEYVSTTGGLTIGTAAAGTLTIAGSPLLVSTSLAGVIQTVTSSPSDYVKNTDAMFGDTVTISKSPAFGITIGIAAGSASLGSGKLDADGNGTITYSDGSQSVVVGFNLTT